MTKILLTHVAMATPEYVLFGGKREDGSAVAFRLRRDAAGKVTQMQADVEAGEGETWAEL